MKCASSAQVVDEKIEDTLLDLAAYAIMTTSWIKRKQNGI
jgi:hypothetical protein